jgi:hypothetical protein
MESIHIRQRVRPSRYAFVVSGGDFGGALQAASINAALWGGVYNPIVPVEPEDQRNGLLVAFDPDFLVNLTGRDLPATLADRYDERIIAESDLVGTDHRTRQKELTLGFNIIPLLNHVHEREVRFTSEPTRAGIIVPGDAEDLAGFVAFAFGLFRWIPETDIKFDELFQRGLRARTVEMLDLSPPPDFDKLVPPLELTRYGLRRSRGSGSFSSHIVFIGDHRNVTDLVAYWNIRATGRHMTFVPIAAYRAFEPSIRVIVEGGNYPLNQRVQNSTQLQKAPSVEASIFEEVCDWIASLNVGPVSRCDWAPRFGVEIDRHVGDIHVADLVGAEGEEISILEDSKMTPVKLVLPPYLSDSGVDPGSLRWSVEITMSGASREPGFMFSFPNEAEVERTIRRSMFRLPGDLRLGRRGLVVHQDHPRATFFPAPVPTKDVFEALFRQAGLETTPSQPGQYAEQIITKMGSLHGGCRVFKVRGVREILDKLGDGSILTKGNMNQLVASTTADEHGQNWRSELYEDLVLRAGQRRPLDFSTIFDVLLEHRILRPGFKFRCATCFVEDWYHVSEFSEEYACRFCFTTQRVDFASKREWQYKADGLFRIPDSAQGSVAVILSLWRLEHESLDHHGRFVSSRNILVRSTGARHEIDYAYVVTGSFDTSYELVLGQATRFSDFTDKDMETMADLAARFPRPPYLAFSTLKGKFSDADQARLKELGRGGHRVIALTREELDPYDLFGRFERAPHRYATTLAEFSENTLHLNVGHEVQN